MQKHDMSHDPPPPYPGTASEAPPYASLSGAEAAPQMGSVHQMGAGPYLPAGSPIGPPGQRMVIGHVVGPDPIHIMCPSCHTAITTRIEPKTTTRTHIVAGVLCLLFGLLCVWLPYCLDTCKNADHYCPNCEAYIGSYSR